MTPSRLQTGSRSKSAAFTLIEVLVVVAIIALLIAILMPSLAKARWQAKLTSCNANLHDFGVSHLVYAHSNDPYFIPPIYVGYSGGTGSIPSIGLFSDDNLFGLYKFKYAKNIASWSCPATTHKVRQPIVTPQAALIHKNAINGLPAKDFQDFDYVTDNIPDQLDFRQNATNDASGYGSSYEYKGWSICGQDKCDKRFMNWWHVGYGTQVLGTLMTTRINKPSPQYAMLMHDADDGPSSTGIPNPGAQNDTPEEWDNHGKEAMNVLFVDGHAVSARTYKINASGETQLGQIWNRSDCGQDVFNPPPCP